MFFRSAQLWRFMAVTLIVALFAPALISISSTKTDKLPIVKLTTAAHHFGGKKNSLNREQLAREAEIWHEINRRRLAESHALGPRR